MRTCRWTLGCMLQNHLDFAKAHYVLAPGLRDSLSSQLTPALCGCGGKATDSSKLSEGNVERQLLLVRPCHAPSSPPPGAQGWATQWSEPLQPPRQGERCPGRESLGRELRAAPWVEVGGTGCRQVQGGEAASMGMRTVEAGTLVLLLSFFKICIY